MSDFEFTVILKPHYDDAVNYCRALCSGSSKAEAEDVMQQSLLKAYENFDSLIDKESFKSWLFTIITRSFYDSIRKPFWSRFVSLMSDDGQVAFQVFEESYFEENRLLMVALNQISKKERVALLLFEIGGFSIKEITKNQNEKSESAVKSRLSRTRKKLKEFMADLEKDERVSTQHVFPIKTKSKDLYHETSKIIKEIKSIG